MLGLVLRERAGGVVAVLSSPPTVLAVEYLSPLGILTICSEQMGIPHAFVPSIYYSQEHFQLR